MFCRAHTRIYSLFFCIHGMASLLLHQFIQLNQIHTTHSTHRFRTRLQVSSIQQTFYFDFLSSLVPTTKLSKLICNWHFHCLQGRSNPSRVKFSDGSIASITIKLSFCYLTRLIYQTISYCFVVCIYFSGIKRQLGVHSICCRLRQFVLIRV